MGSRGSSRIKSGQTHLDVEPHQLVAQTPSFAKSAPVCWPLSYPLPRDSLCAPSRGSPRPLSSSQLLRPIHISVHVFTDGKRRVRGSKGFICPGGGDTTMWEPSAPEVALPLVSHGSRLAVSAPCHPGEPSGDPWPRASSSS